MAMASDDIADSTLSLLQGFEIAHERIQFVVAQLHCRHERSRLDGIRVLYPQPKILRIVLRCTGRDRATAHQVSQVRTKTPGAVCAVDCMAVQARSSLEDSSSCGFFFIFIRRLLLSAYPELEVLRTIHVHAQ